MLSVYRNIIPLKKGHKKDQMHSYLLLIININVEQSLWISKAEIPYWSFSLRVCVCVSYQSGHSHSSLAAPQRSIVVYKWPASLFLSVPVSLPRVSRFSWPTYIELPVWTLRQRAKQQPKLSLRATSLHPSLTVFDLKCAVNWNTSPLSPYISLKMYLNF